MLNQVVLMGRLTRDPELRRTQSGVAVTSFTLAVERDYKEQSGERLTDFIDVVAWRHTAEFACKYFRKGSMTAVTGRLQKRSWIDNDGNTRYNVEVIAESVYFADSKRNDASSVNSEEPQFSEYSDDDLPF